MRRVRGLLRISLSYNILLLFSTDASIYVSFSPSYIPLTSYVARHAWASIAKSKNIPISTISEAMGHDSENTTRIYLASLDTSVVDKANSLILKSL